MKYTILLFALCLTACSVNNTVEYIEPDHSVVKFSKTAGYEDRFINLFAKFKDYPVTCNEDCYQPSDVIACCTKMQDCTYTGKHPNVTLNTGFTVKWLGHASFQINTDNGQQFLFDPVFEQFDWPVNWAFRLAAGFNRTPPQRPQQTLFTATDAVMYSHIHYDHFNKSDIEQFSKSTRFLTPLGFADHFPSAGFRISEMAWYANKTLGDVTAHFVPAHHFSNRIVVPFLYEDENTTLWGGWLLDKEGKTLFFAGDTGYSPHFKQIAEKFGSIDVCLLPIASYFSEDSPDFYRQVHTTPEDALIAASELNCKVMVPWGYGNASWRMGDKTSHSALFRLLTMHKRLASDIPLYILNEGEHVTF
ncbi:MAG: MBL fold metallo-hydrolase [Alteromonadaceae bacterium]|nr:MBL fold metallo-hydrolase [Alteromonadaceae bacterium]